MQKFVDRLNESDRRIARKWGLATMGFYGSILAGMVLYAALHRDMEVNVASANTGAHARIVAPTGAREPARPSH